MANVFVELLDSENDRGVQATLNALKSLGIARWDPMVDAWSFIEIRVTNESLHREIDLGLKRHG